MNAELTLRTAEPRDVPWLTRDSGPPGVEVVSRQVREGRLQIIELAAQPVGFIKTCVLWETLPFMEVIYLDQDQRGLGNGTRAVRLWEADLQLRGFDLVAVSTSAASTSQHFWRKAGYVDCGALIVRNKPAEVFMQRALTAT